MKQNNLFKYGLMVILLLLGTINAFSQEVIVKYNNYSGRYALYNNRSQKWVTRDLYEEGWCMGSIDGVFYYAMKRGNLFGVLDETGKVILNCQFEKINASLLGGFHNGFFAVKMTGSWGVANIHNVLVIPCEYESVFVYSSYVFLCDWKGRTKEIRMADLMDIRDSLLNEYEQQQRAIIETEREKVLRARKEKELSSFTGYAKKYIRPMLTSWSKKGEFEKQSDYEARVSGPGRKAFVDSLLDDAKQSYLSENAALYLNDKDIRLGQYNAEDEFFEVESSRFGKLNVPVPIAEAPDFKIHFDSLERNMKFFIKDDKIALASMEFYDAAVDKTYYYNNPSATYEFKMDDNLMEILINSDDFESDLDLKDAGLLKGSWSSLNNGFESKPTVSAQVQSSQNLYTTFQPDAGNPSSGKIRTVRETVCQYEVNDVHFQFREVVTSSGKYEYSNGRLVCTTDPSTLDVKVYDLKGLDSNMTASQKKSLEQLRKKLPEICKKTNREYCFEHLTTELSVVFIDKDTIVLLSEPNLSSNLSSNRAGTVTYVRDNSR